MMAAFVFHRRVERVGTMNRRQKIYVISGKTTSGGRRLYESFSIFWRRYGGDEAYIIRAILGMLSAWLPVFLSLPLRVT